MAERQTARVRMIAALAGLALGVGFGGAAWADGQGAALTPAELAAARGVIQQIPLGPGLTLELRKGYVFLPAGDVAPILQGLNAPAPSATILGAVTAERAKPGAKAYWISVITQDDIGHVPENGADEIGSMAFFDSVKAARPAAPPLSAFAVAPAYGPVSKTLIWAERYDGATPASALRHEQRLLGRASVAGVTTIGPVSALPNMSAAAKDVLSMLTFAAGSAYADFNAATDRVSEYDLPGLITGKRKAGPIDEIADAGAAETATPITLADFAPGGKLQWVTWLGGGAAALATAYFAIGALRPRRSGDVDYTAQDGDGDTA